MLALTDNDDLARFSDWFVEHALSPSVSIIALIAVAHRGAVARPPSHRPGHRSHRGGRPGPLRVAWAAASAEPDKRVASRRSQRAKSLGSLLKSVATGVIFGVVFVMCLAEVDVNVAPILASAGVVGLALGFGAQTLVKDLLSGIFMLIEDQYGVGDVVDLGEAIGTVEAVGLRITRLRDIDGTVWYVRNGEILRVGNRARTGPAPSSTSGSATSRPRPASGRCCRRSPTTCGSTRSSAA